MDVNCDTNDIDLSEDDNKIYRNKMVIDVPSTTISGISDANSTIPTWDSSAIRASSASLSDTCHRLYECIQPALASGLYASAVSESMSNSMNRIAESIKPLISASTMEGITSVAESAMEMLATNTAISESCEAVTNAAIEAVSPSLAESIVSTRSVVSLFAERMTASFDISRISAAISKLICFQDLFDETIERIRETFSRITETMQAVWDRAGHSLSGLAHLLFHHLYHAWQKRPRFLTLPWHDSVKAAASFVNIGLSPPGKVREYVVRIRQQYLLKHQRKSDDSEDLNDSFTCLCSTINLAIFSERRNNSVSGIKRLYQGCL